ncbi:MAG TPA: DUF1697 domain-containing protein [Patescibacteria group bacterium]|nr:DUF1697 domain-containing protein [Patescibacteria group bacterium]
MHTYLVFLRGVNVGGKAMIKMAELTEALTTSGLSNVKTYIQSGNVIISSEMTDTEKLTSHITTVIKKKFNLDVSVVIFSESEWRDIIAAAPAWWGADKTWKHNMLIMIKPAEPEDVIAAIGEIRPEIETIEPGLGILYQSLSLKMFGRTSVHKLVANPIYKQVTIRNYNTATKLLSLLT